MKFRNRFFLALATAVLLWTRVAFAEPIVVRHVEGLVHGFLSLRSAGGTLLADGDLIQNVRGDRVTSRLVFHFKDGSLLIGGGTLPTTYSRRELHRPEKAVRRLTRYLDARFPDLQIKFAACWPGLIGISKDFAPVVGSHPRYSSVLFAAGAAGLPWAAALGRYLAEKVLDGRNDVDAMLTVHRRFPIGPYLQAVLGAPLAFAMSHGILKFSSK